MGEPGGAIDSDEDDIDVSEHIPGNKSDGNNNTDGDMYGNLITDIEPIPPQIEPPPDDGPQPNAANADGNLVEEPFPPTADPPLMELEHGNIPVIYQGIPDLGVSDLGVLDSGVPMCNDNDDSANDSDDDSIISEEVMDTIADIANNERLDDAELDAEGVYHPDTATPSIQRGLVRRIPLLTRSRINSQRQENTSFTIV